MTKRAEMRAPSWPLYSLAEAARAQMTSRGSAVERSTLEELKFVVPKSLEDIAAVVERLGFFRSEFSLDCRVEGGMWNV